VPALAALVGCGPDTPQTGVDPCLPASYQQQACEYAVANKGYYNQGTWFPHVYPYAPLFYYNGYSRYVASGGRPRALPMSAYTPAPNGARGRSGFSSSGRSTVVRGGFGGIGGSRGFGGG
jgi:uncharacterized membrane protein YgcG